MNSKNLPTGVNHHFCEPGQLLSMNLLLTPFDSIAKVLSLTFFSSLSHTSKNLDEIENYG